MVGVPRFTPSWQHVLESSASQYQHSPVVEHLLSELGALLHFQNDVSRTQQPRAAGEANLGIVSCRVTIHPIPQLRDENLSNTP
jgi:hypothetical protein